MLFPYGENISNKKIPWVIVAIVTLLFTSNILIFYYLDQNVVFEHLAFNPLEFSLQPFKNLYTLLTAFFLHTDIFHLLGNSLFLLIFGKAFVELFGKILFIFCLPLLGVVGFLSQWAVIPNTNVSVVGASGSIAFFMGAYLALFPRSKIKFIIIFVIFFKRFNLPAWIFLPYWICFQMFSFLMGADDGVAYAVHIGSFGLGVITAVIWKTSSYGADEKLSKLLAG